MNIFRHAFFARAGFALNEHRHVKCGDTLCQSKSVNAGSGSCNKFRHRVNDISSDRKQDIVKRITGGINKFELNDNKNIILW